jgi:hypothetical protein
MLIDSHETKPLMLEMAKAKHKSRQSAEQRLISANQRLINRRTTVVLPPNGSVFLEVSQPDLIEISYIVTFQNILPPWSAGHDAKTI